MDNRKGGALGDGLLRGRGGGMPGASERRRNDPCFGVIADDGGADEGKYGAGYGRVQQWTPH